MQNDVVLGQTWDGPPLRLKKEGKPVTFMAPQEGAFAWLDGLSIPIGAKNFDETYTFLNCIYDSEVNGLIANETGYNRSEEHTSELQSLMRISYAVFCFHKKKLMHIAQRAHHIRHARDPITPNNTTS